MGEAADMYQTFLAQHQLPDSYASSARSYFEPVAQHLLELQQAKQAPYFVALNGCQGSGKSTLADFLVHWFEAHGKAAIAISLDDFYLTQAERQALAEQVHPLFKTRGVPGTHDTGLMVDVLSSLAVGKATDIPRFNKAIDDRVEPSEWTSISDPVDIVILEGWCWGARHQSEDDLLTSVNDLETAQDADGIWRSHVNQTLTSDYEPLYAFMDFWLMLKAPSFDCVYRWRLEQEEKLRARLSVHSDIHSDTDSAPLTASSGLMATQSGLMTSEQIAQFIQFYQRITERLLITLPEHADVVWHLDEDRRICLCTTRASFNHINSSSYREGE